MGRAKINDLTEFFLFQFGPAEGVAFQRARSNFIQSMAAYSVLCYILQIKDRHNGNIMIDGEGRITHIDFGFLFDIGPGGIKFEPNSFKLTHEMITLMGGKNSQGYRQFRELTVKAFLACRPYVEDVLSTCSLMMPTQLPSFKGEGTMIRLRDRFKPDLTEREAARYMIGVIENACENSMSIVYDQFQVSLIRQKNTTRPILIRRVSRPPLLSPTVLSKSHSLCFIMDTSVFMLQNRFVYRKNHNLGRYISLSK